MINVPIGAVLIAMAVAVAVADVGGAVTGTAGLAVLIYGVMRSADHG